MPLNKSTATIQQLMKDHLKTVSTARLKKLAAVQKVPGGFKPNCWPMASYALGCPPKQVPAMKKFLADKGVKCDFNSRGQALLMGPHHRARVSAAREMFDMNAGYSDAAPSNVHYNVQREEEAKLKLLEQEADKVDQDAIQVIRNILSRRR